MAASGVALAQAQAPATPKAAGAPTTMVVVDRFVFEATTTSARSSWSRRSTYRWERRSAGSISTSVWSAAEHSDECDYKGPLPSSNVIDQKNESRYLDSLSETQGYYRIGLLSAGRRFGLFSTSTMLIRMQDVYHSSGGKLRYHDECYYTGAALRVRYSDKSGLVTVEPGSGAPSTIACGPVTRPRRDRTTARRHDGDAQFRGRKAERAARMSLNLAPSPRIMGADRPPRSDLRSGALPACSPPPRPRRSRPC
jgi:hypothetical protein